MSLIENVRRHISESGRFLVDEPAELSPKVESQQRDQQTILALKRILRLIVTLQSRVRGFLVRTALSTIRRRRINAYRKQICYLWRRTYTPLWYRTWFWSVVNRYRFLHLTMHEDELIRLWSELGLKAMEYEEQPIQDILNGDATSETKYGRVERMLRRKTSAVYQRYLLVQRKLDSVKGKAKRNKSSLRVPIFPTELAAGSFDSGKTPSVKQKAKNLVAARKRLGKERDELCSTLKSHSKQQSSFIIRMADAFRIPENTRKKERKVADLVWEHRAYAKMSSEITRLHETKLEESGKGGNNQRTNEMTEMYQEKLREARYQLYFIRSISQNEGK